MNKAVRILTKFYLSLELPLTVKAVQKMAIPIEKKIVICLLRLLQANCQPYGNVNLA